MKLRRLLTLALAAAFLFVAPITAKADTETATEPRGWVQDAKGWWYECGINEDGTSIYYADGVAAIDSAATPDEMDYYYFDKAGYMQKGWIYVPTEYTNTRVDENGKEIEYTWKDGYWMYANAEGRLQTGWEVIDGKWYYFDGFTMASDCTMSIYSEYTEKTAKYHFAESGEMTTGWYWDSFTNGGGEWYYSDANGVVSEGWDLINGKWYCFYYDGSMRANTYYWDYTLEKERLYYFGADGVMVTGWYNRAGSNSVYGDWVYANADGTITAQWVQSGADWYYVDSYGNMIQDTYLSTMVKEDGTVYYETGRYAKALNVYYFGIDGKMITGWYDDSYKSANYSFTSWMYANADGTITAQWVKSGNDWYWISASGVMAANGTAWCNPKNIAEPMPEYYSTYEEYVAAYDYWREINTYVFDASGKLVTNGWYLVTDTYGSTWIYANANGNIVSNGWVQDAGKWYYCDEDGVMVTNAWVDGYWVGADGAWVQ